MFRSTPMATVLAWAALLSAVMLALLYLNSAAYSAWLGGGPPTTIRQAWMQRAFAHLCYASAAVFIGFGAFRVIRKLPRSDRLGLALGLVGIIAMAPPHVRRLVLVYRCSEAGWRWNPAAFRCGR